MAEPTIIAGSTSAVSSNVIALTYPTTTAGHAIYAVIKDRASSTITPPSGWTEAHQVYDTEATSRLFLFKKDDPATGSESGTETFTFSASNRKAGFIFSTSGDLLDGDYSTGGFVDTASSINHDTVTTTGPDRLVIYVYAAATTPTYTPAVADFAPAQTQLAEVARAQTNSVYVGIGYEGRAAAGAGTVRSSTYSGTPADAYLSQFTFAVYSSGGGGGDPAITDIDSDESITDGQGTFTVTTTDFGGTVDSIVISDGTYTSAELFDGGSAGSYTADATNILNQSGDSAVGQPNWFAGALTLTADDGTDSAELGVAWAPASGWTTQVLTGSTAVEGNISYGRSGGAYANNSVAYYPTAEETSISADGTISTSATTDFSFYVWSSSNGRIEEVSVSLALTITPDPGSLTISGYSIDLYNSTVVITPANAALTVAGQSLTFLAQRTIEPETHLLRARGLSMSLGGSFGGGDSGVFRSVIRPVIF